MPVFGKARAFFYKTSYGQVRRQNVVYDEFVSRQHPRPLLLTLQEVLFLRKQVPVAKLPDSSSFPIFYFNEPGNSISNEFRNFRIL
jgi:hypothetical protein